jgi:hypothetical protein
MLRNHGWFALMALTLVVVIGCGKSDGPSQQSAASADRSARASASGNAPGRQATDTPEAACREFLEAVRTGNDEKASLMLSALAREKAAALGCSVTPPASDTARFAIGKVKYVGEDGAQVESVWADVDNSDNQEHSDKLIWVLRREDQGWRVAGLAATIFPGEPPLLLNFENPDEVMKKQQWAREEIRRRTEKESLQAKESESGDNSMRR